MFLESIVAANIVRPWLKYLAVAIAVLAAVWWWNRWLDGRDEAAFERGQIAGRAEVQARWDQAEARRREVAAQAEKDSRAKERKLQEKANVAIARSAQRAASARADADAARGSERLLRDELDAFRVRSSGRPENSCAAADARTSAVGELLATCTEEYRGMATKAQSHLVDALSAREAWPTTEAK